tara:strand:- start:439 stop:1149 length:711 start_codon:yes stop_codon:yes gene_type:complete
MARISTYGNATPVVAADKWIGTDSKDNNATKNFTAQAVANFINKLGGQQQNLRYTYNDTNTYESGSISFQGGGAASVLLNGITAFNLGVFQTRSLTINIGDYISQAFLNNDILLTQTDDITNWAIYTVNSTVLKGSNLEYQLTVTYKAGGGSLIADKDYFISLLGLAGAASDLNKLVILPGNSLVYIVDHNLNKFPSVSVIEAATGNQVYGEVKYNSVNQCTLTFTSLLTGTATFN